MRRLGATYNDHFTDTKTSERCFGLQNSSGITDTLTARVARLLFIVRRAVVPEHHTTPPGSTAFDGNLCGGDRK